MSAPRVLLLGTLLGQPPGGVRRHNAQLLPRVGRLLRARGGSLTVLSGREGIAFALPPEVEILTSELPPSPAPWRALRESRELHRLFAKNHRFDLVHTAHHPVPARLPIPYTLTVHDLRALSSLGSPWRRLFAEPVLARSLRGAARVLTVSDAIADEIAEGFAIDRERLSVIPNAADHFEPLPRRRAPDARMLHVGHLEPRKNLGLLLEALAIAPDLPDLELAGAPKGSAEADLRERARALGIADRVHFLGPFPEPELPRLLSAAACVVLPSRVEGFGIGVLEAQRALVPLAISDIPAHREVAHPTTPRFAVDDPRACARALRAALTLPAAHLQTAAHSTSRFSWDDSAQSLLDAWRSATD